MKPLSAEQQKAIMDGAVQLFATQNLKDISLDQLSRVSGFPPSTSCATTSRAENILKGVLERELELMAAAAHAPELRMPGETLKDELHVLAGVILQEHRQRLPFLRKLMVESMDNKDVATLFYSTFIVQGRRLFTEFLDERKRLGELREDLDVEAAAALFLVSISARFGWPNSTAASTWRRWTMSACSTASARCSPRRSEAAMNVAVLGFDGPVSRSLRAELERQGHKVDPAAKDCLVYFPGNEEEFFELVANGGYARIVLRGHAYVYGSSPKNPGMMTEERVSLLPG